MPKEHKFESYVAPGKTRCYVCQCCQMLLEQEINGPLFIHRIKKLCLTHATEIAGYWNLPIMETDTPFRYCKSYLECTELHGSTINLNVFLIII